MPRQASLDIPGVLHHIMVRGINRSLIFREDQDKRNFLEHLGQLCLFGRTGCNSWAWVYLSEALGHTLLGQGIPDRWQGRNSVRLRPDRSGGKAALAEIGVKPALARTVAVG